MCLSPIVKHSNKKYFLPGRWQSFYNTYPCGECAECKRDRELDDYIRTLWESKYVFNVCHGYAIFDTLSYDNKHLPHVSDVCKDLGIKLRYNIPEFYNLSCFRLADWRSFITNLNADIVYYIKKQLKIQVEVMFNKTLTMRQLHKIWKSWFKKVYGFKCPDHLFNYMMASEFGHDDEYIDDRGNMRKGTKRPHYHVIFFSYLPEYVLSPENFSRAINKSWHRGRTDGVDWPNKWHRSQREWREKRVFSDIKDNTLNVNVLNVLSYIAKYVHKDADFRDKFEPIEGDIFNFIYPQYDYDDFWKLLSGDYKNYKLWKRFKRNLYNFSKKGHDFGIYYVDWLNSPEGQQERDKIIDKGYIALPLNKNQKVYRHRIPTYYANKLFKEFYINKDGYKRWRPNKLGLDVKKKQILLSIHNMVRKYKEFISNSVVYMDPVDYVKLQSILNKFDGDEQLSAFLYFVARWFRLFEGRIIDKYVEHVDYQYFNVDSLPTWKEMIDIIVENMSIDADDDMRQQILSGVGESFKFDGEYVIFNYATFSDVAQFGKSFLCNENLGNNEYGYKINKDLGWQMETNQYYDFNPKRSDLSIDDPKVFGWMEVLSWKNLKGYEDVGLFNQLFSKYRCMMSEDKQEKVDYVDALVSHYEKLGIKTKNK